jgi:uncharacterized protein (UPF0333 family)
MNAFRAGRRAQSSLELLITLSFGLVVLLPIITLAIIQISASSSTLSVAEAQQAADRLAAVAVQVGTQGFPARQLVVLQIPEDVQAVYVGTTSNGLGNEVIFVLDTNGGQDYVTAYTPINVSGWLPSIQSPATYLLNISAVQSCPPQPSLPCVFIKQAASTQ